MYDSQTFSRESDKKGNQQRENDLSSLTEDDEKIQSSYIGLLTTSVFPWGILSKHASKRVNRVALKVGNLIQAMMFLIWVPYIQNKGNFIIIHLPKLYSPVYLETTENCSTYYLFNSTSFEHYIVDLGKSKAFNETIFNDNCLHLPIVVLGSVLVWFLRRWWDLDGHIQLTGGMDF